MGEAEVLDTEPEVEQEAPAAEASDAEALHANMARSTFGLPQRGADGKFLPSDGGEPEDGVLTEKAEAAPAEPAPAPAAGEAESFKFSGKEFKSGDVLYQKGRVSIIYGERYRTPEAAMDALEREFDRREQQSQDARRQTPGAPVKPEPAPELPAFDIMRHPAMQQLGTELSAEGVAAVGNLIRDAFNAGMTSFRDKELAPLRSQMQAPLQIAEERVAMQEFNQTALEFESAAANPEIDCLPQLRGATAQDAMEALSYLNQIVPDYRRLSEEARTKMLIDQVLVNRIQQGSGQPAQTTPPVNGTAKPAPARRTPVLSGPRVAQTVPAGRSFTRTPTYNERMGFKAS